MQQGSFGYRIYCVNTFEPVDTNIYNTALYLNGPPNYNSQMLNATHELRLTFLWPQSPNGNLGSGRHTFRTTIAGQLLRQPNLSPAALAASPVYYNPNLYVYQPQTFVNSP